MKLNKNVLIAGFAMFSMFFGSGNLVFPLMVGVGSTSMYPYAILGLLVTAVLMPFVGLVGISLFDGNREDYFSSLGAKPALLLAFIILALEGPFGVSPRCIIVAYGGFAQLMPDLSFTLFSAIFCLVVGILIWKKNRVVEILGSVLTPVLLVSIVIIIVAGIFTPKEYVTSVLTGFESFNMGFYEGYQTTDLLAAFFFGATAVQYIKRSLPEGSDSKGVLKLGLSASLLGAGLLAIVYVGFIILGAKYSAELQGYEPGEYLIMVAHFVLGKYSVPVIGVAFVLACLTTATILISLFSDFIQKEVLKGIISRHMVIIMSLVLTFAFSCLGFSTIREWLGAIVYVMYPALIGYAIANLFCKLYGFEKSGLVFYMIFVFSVFVKLVY